VEKVYWMLKTVNSAVKTNGVSGLIGTAVQKLVIMEDKIGVANVNQECVRVVISKVGGVTHISVSQSGAPGVYGLHAV
jgi:hypothetical protein